jgi:hypothetical protein
VKVPPNYIKDGKKRCNGPLHKGEFVPLKEFWIHKGKWRTGLPFSQCKHCENYRKFGDTAHGLVPYSKVGFIFEELENRLGKAETARRIGVSTTFFYRRRRQEYKNVRIKTVIRAMTVLKECREKNEVRHKRSIIYGAAARGKEERAVNELSRFTNYYNGHSDIRNEYSLKSHHRQRAKKRSELTTLNP